MKTAIKLFSLIVAVLLASACGGVQTPTPTAVQPTQAPIIQPTQPPTQAASQANVTCSKLSLFLDPILGSGYECQTIAEGTSSDMGNYAVHPEYTEVTLKNYPFTDSAYTPHIDVFPVLRYRELSPDIMPAREADLQSLISGGPSGSSELPLLPIFNSKQAFSAQVKMIEFQNGKGIRYITQYNQGIVPINNQGMFYTFQGLTADNQYWISIILPISNANLMADGKNPPNGQSMEDFTNSYLKYLADTTAQLNAQSVESFTPSLAAQDALVNSIVVQP